MTYWLVFFLLATFAFVESRRISTNNGYLNSSFNPLWWFFVIFLSIFIGLRHQVGGDWSSYEVYFDLLSYKDLDEIFDVRHDMGYAGLNCFVSKICAKRKYGSYCK